MSRIDSHCHVWKLSRNDYDWLDVDDPNFVSIARDFDVRNLEQAAAPSGIGRFILVQAAATENETDFLLSMADQHESVMGVVGWVDLADEQVAHRIQRFSVSPFFKGVRPMLQDIENTRWLIDIPDESVWTHLSHHGLGLDALVQPRHLEMMYEFCQAQPDLPVVIDHAAKPAIGRANKSDLQHWQQCMTKLANQTNAYCKVSGLLTEMSLEQTPNAVTVLQPYVDHLLNVFGPQRLMWGSDWPVVRMAGSYSSWNDLTLALLQDLNSQDLEAVLSQTAARFYGLDMATNS